MTSDPYKRRNYFIKKAFQLKYTLSIVSVLLVVMIASGFGLYYGMRASIIENFSKFKVSENLENVKRITAYEEARFKKGDYRLEKTFREAELLSEKEKETLNSAFKSVNKSLIPKVIGVIFLIFIAGIFASHKIAGPMYRFEKSARAICDGDLTVNFNVRKSDRVKETASVLENMVESLRSDIGKVKLSVANLGGAVKSLSGKVSDEDAERLVRLIKEIDGILSKYRT